MIAQLSLSTIVFFLVLALLLLPYFLRLAARSNDLADSLANGYQ